MAKNVMIFFEIGCNRPGKIRTLVSTSPIHEALRLNRKGVESATKVAASKSGIKALEHVHHEYVVSSSKDNFRLVFFLEVAPRVMIMVS